MHHKVLPSSELRFQTANIWNYIKYDLAKNTNSRFAVIRKPVNPIQKYQTPGKTGSLSSKRKYSNRKQTFSLILL